MTAAEIYLDLPNPFGLTAPKASWLQPIFDYDPYLRIFPSQKDYVYRLARVAVHSGGMSSRLFKETRGLHPDTRYMLRHRLVAVSTIPVGGIFAPPELVVDWLRRHDVTAHGGAEKVADLLDARDQAREDAVDKHNREEIRDRARAMRVGYLYRTGARVSLVRPMRPKDALSSPGTPGATSALTVSPKEVR